MADSAQLEGLLTANRISELHEQPIQGNFDTAHLKEIHRRIFQDLPHHRPGQLRPESSRHMKTRALEGETTRYVVGYASHDLASRLDRILGELRGGDTFKGLAPDPFAEKMARLYGDLDHIHAFSEGNSRTLREFTRELALQAGYELDWHSTNAGALARNRLYVARDVAVYEREYPSLSDEYLREHSRHPDFSQMHHAWHMLKHFAGRERLEDIIRQNLRSNLE